MKERMRRLARAAIAQAMADRACHSDQAACRAVKDARNDAAAAIVDLIWDWFEIRERKRKTRAGKKC
jgi:hypothetical protein